MIITRAPARISFVGGGTDLPDFYRTRTGRVISAAIDKYVYVAINTTPLINKVVARYSSFETVDHPSELKNDRIRAALLDLGIHTNIDITTFSQVPINAGLGSSSSFSVALMKGLFNYFGKRIDRVAAAEAACRLEIDLLKEPIGKQDQYAAALGGMNILQFNQDDSVGVEPVYLDYKKLFGLENSLLLFFTGITRPASSVLAEQKSKIDKNISTLQQMAAAPLEFKELLSRGDFSGLGKLLSDGWLKKRTLASAVSNNILDGIYEAGMDSGAWGGKLLGAGGGGCMLFIAPAEKKNAIRDALCRYAKQSGLQEFKEIPVRFVQSGVEVVVS